MVSVGQVIGITYIVLLVLIALITSILSLLTVKHATSASENGDNKPSCSELVKLWFKTMWKMRGIYSAFVVHVFDVMTDIMVISEWYIADDDKQIEIDSKLMSYLAMGILVFYKLVSSIAILFVSEFSVYRAVLQFFDLYIFEEMIIAHRRVVNKLFTKTDDDDISVNKNNDEDANDDTKEDMSISVAMQKETQGHTQR